MLKIRNIILLGLTAAALCMAGCRSRSGSDENKASEHESLTAGESREDDNHSDAYYSFTDSLGYHVTLQQKPERTAVLFSSFAEVWQLAGGETAVTVGEAVERGFAASDAVLVDAGAGKQINLEALIAAQPDFVICSADIVAQKETAQLLRDASVPCAAFRVESFSDYLSMLKICTDLTGKAENYIRYGTEVGERIETIMEKLPASETKPEILFIRAGAGESAVKAKTAEDHFAAAMLKELGAHNIAEDAPILLNGLSTEEILLRDPDRIFITTMGKEAAAREYMDGVIAGEAWQSLRAVRNGNCCYLPKELFQFKPNARWDEAYRYLAQLLFPEIDFQ